MNLTFKQKSSNINYADARYGYKFILKLITSQAKWNQNQKQIIDQINSTELQMLENDK